MDSVTIVGCGTIGSSLAFWMCLKNLERKTLKELILIDSDSISIKNLPYLFRNDKTFIGMPKVSVLNLLLHEIDESLQIYSSFSTYPPLSGSQLKEQIVNTTIIDCRDTTEINTDTNIKLNFDGNFGRLSFNPDEYHMVKESRYHFGNSKYSALQVTGVCIDLIYSGEFNRRNITYAINTSSPGSIAIERENIQSL